MRRSSRLTRPLVAPAMAIAIAVDDGDGAAEGTYELLVYVLIKLKVFNLELIDMVAFA